MTLALASSEVSKASRYAASGAFASTTTCLPPGMPHDEIGAEAPSSVDDGRLRDVVAVLDHAGVLDDVAQLRLAPAPADVRRSERVREAAGPLRERRHLRLQRAVRLLPDALDVPQLLVHPLERVLERPHVAREVRLRELEEARAVGVERLGRDASSPLRAATRRASSLRRELGLRRGELALERDRPPARAGDARRAPGARRRGRRTRRPRDR